MQFVKEWREETRMKTRDHQSPRIDGGRDPITAARQADIGPSSCEHSLSLVILATKKTPEVSGHARKILEQSTSSSFSYVPSAGFHPHHQGSNATYTCDTANVLATMSGSSAIVWQAFFSVACFCLKSAQTGNPVLGIPPPPASTALAILS
jgi:hypothetical protein